jgi:hypothetical protein
LFLEYTGDESVKQNDYHLSPEILKMFSFRENITPQIFENPTKSGRLLVFHDSFGKALKKYLPLNFNKTAFFNADPSEETLSILIDDFSPDVVLFIRIERYPDGLIIK